MIEWEQDMREELKHNDLIKKIYETREVYRFQLNYKKNK